MEYFKDTKAFEDKEGVCYIPEHFDEQDAVNFTYDDFLEISKGNDKLAKIIFNLCNWQHPETVFQELLNEEEINENGEILI